MSRKKKYTDKQVKWMIRLFEAEMKATNRAIKVYNETMDAWKSGHNEWKSRMESLTNKTLTRNEAWIFIIALTGFALMIWLKK